MSDRKLSEDLQTDIDCMGETGHGPSRHDVGVGAAAGGHDGAIVELSGGAVPRRRPEEEGGRLWRQSWLRL